MSGRLSAWVDAHGCATNDETGAWACWGKNASGQATPPLPGGTPAQPFPFQGFYPPLAPDTGDVPVLNPVKAGSSVPLKFSLGGDQGLEVVEVGFPRVRGRWTARAWIPARR